MNKENSMTVQNETSTQIGDSMKSYSSKYRQLKQIRSFSKKSLDVLPVKLERAAITIQRFWRRRMVLRKRLYQCIQDELDSQVHLLQFQNQGLANIISVYQADCRAREHLLKGQAQRNIKQSQLDCSNLVKRLVGFTFCMEKKKISEYDLQDIQNERNSWKNKVEMLRREKEMLQDLLSGEVQEEQQQFMRKIKQETFNLLKITKQRGELEKQLREKMVESCRRGINN